jgi:hypothetical protein
MMIKEALIVLGLFSRKQDADLELLPPPPPFPDLEPSKKKEAAKPKQKKAPKEKTKIVLKHRETTNDLLEEAMKLPRGEPEELMSTAAPQTAVSQDEMMMDSEEISNAIGEAKKSPEQKIGFWKRLFTPKIKNDVAIQEPAKTPFKEENLAKKVNLDTNSAKQKIEELQTPIEEVMGHVQMARDSLENLDLQKAKDGYVEAMKLYRMMTKEEQEQVYEIIQELYEERKNAEKMSNK